MNKGDIDKFEQRFKRMDMRDRHDKVHEIMHKLNQAQGGDEHFVTEDVAFVLMYLAKLEGFYAAMSGLGRDYFTEDIK